jgi:hypothetical protein
MLYTRFHAIRKRWLPIRRAVIGAVLATSEAKQNPTSSSALSTKNDPNAEVTVQDSGTTFGLRVNPVQVHVVVRDANNNPVANLRQEDFQLFDPGKLPISLFSMETRKTRREKAEAATKTPVAGAEPIKSGNTVLPDRFIALMFDDSRISLDDATYFRQVAPRFLDGVIPN